MLMTKSEFHTTPLKINNFNRMKNVMSASRIK